MAFEQSKKIAFDKNPIEQSKKVAFDKNPIEQSTTDTYNKIAQDFANSRFSRWNEVERFINTLPNSKILDAGCGGGNGMFNRTIGDFRCLSSRSVGLLDCKSFPTHEWYGCDSSEELVKICLAKSLRVCIGDICELPYNTNEFDAVICIAVFHHLSTRERRIAALHELIRVLKPNGKLLISMLRDTYTQHMDKAELIDKDNPFDVNIAFANHTRYYHLFQENEFNKLVLDTGISCNIECIVEKMNYYYKLSKVAL